MPPPYRRSPPHQATAQVYTMAPPAASPTAPVEAGAGPAGPPAPLVLPFRRLPSPEVAVWNRRPLHLLLDRLAFPLLALLSSEGARRLGLTPIDDERVLACLPHCQGLLLDVGCGPNHP